MSLIVYIAHTGLRLETDQNSLPSLDALKSWVAKESSIPESHQVVLTSRGKLVRNLNSTSDAELFVYDRVLFTVQEGQHRASSPEIPIPELYTPLDPPASLSDQSNLQSWQTLFKERRQWAVQLSEETERFLDDVQHFDSQAAVIQRATAIASERLKQNTSGLKDKYAKAKTWVDETLQEPKLVTSDFKNSIGRLNLIEASGDLLRFFQPPVFSKTALPKSARVTLRSLVDTDDARDAATRASDAIQWLERQTSELGRKHEDLLQDCSTLVDGSQKDFAGLDGGDVSRMINNLSEEVQAILNKISNDCETALNSPDNARNISGLSRLASNHTHILLPSLADTAKEISEVLQRTIERRNRSQTLALQTMQQISLMEIRFADIQSGISGLGLEEEDDRLAFEAMSFIAGLPAMYASVLCEIVRRREWTEKMMTDSSTLAEEMATHKDDEERRRSKWSKNIQEFLQPDMLESKALDIDVNLKNQSITWPKVTRHDINNYANQLRSIGGYESVLQDIAEQIKGLDAPSKQQVRRTNAFRNGSIHDATYGRQSLLLRGDNEVIGVLQADKTRLEDRLKGSESRIRKLEDLLHRQSQVVRVPGSSPRNSLDRPPPSPIVAHPGLASPKNGHDNFSRRSSTSSRRVSGNFGPEEKALAQRIVQLEAELVTERTRVAQSQDHIRAQEDLKLQVQEATSMKKDLMENFNAQQTEFDGERRLFTEENKKLKMKVEELEEEIDRLIGSNDNVKLDLDGRVQAHTEEIATIQKESSDEVQRLQGQLDFVKRECEAQREKAYSLEHQIQSSEAEKRRGDTRISELEKDIKSRDEQREEHQKSLQAIFTELSEGATAPVMFNSLIEEAESLSRKASSHLNDMRVALGSVQAENAAYREQLFNREEELSALQEEHTSLTNTAESLREDLDSEKARFLSLEEEFEDGKKELEALRSKLADGESGPEALKSRLAIEEEKVASVRLELASIKAHNDRLEESMVGRAGDLEALREIKLEFEHALIERAKRAESVSVLLFSQTDRLTHLLEHIGYSVTREGDSMVVQRIPRSSTSASTVNVDQSQSMNRSLSGPVPKTTSAPPDYIHWAMSGDNEQEETQFDMFMQESQAFDMDAFSEAIVKRIKDTEHIARKWQREAKSYREKFQRAQFESLHKIAFRSFREGDLALFLPTRNTAPNQRSWAAFNVNAPHYFLREKESHRLSSRDWLLARISKVEERVVDLSKSESSLKPLPSSSASSMMQEDDNPFGLSDGLRWYFLDAAEEKLGAPTTPGLAKTTVASAHVDAAGSIQRKKEPDDGTAVTRSLAKSLDSRRSSGNSRKSLVGAAASPVTATAAHHAEGATSGLRTAESASPATTDPARANTAATIPEEGPRPMAALSRRADLWERLARGADGSEGERERDRSPDKGRAWDSLLSLDVNLEGKGKRRGGN